MADTNARGKSFLSILLSIVVLMLISSMIVAAIVMINPDIANFSSKLHATREAISLEEAILGELSAKDFNFNWLPADPANGPDSNEQLLFEEAKNLQLVTMPSAERRIKLLQRGPSSSPAGVSDDDRPTKRQSTGQNGQQQPSPVAQKFTPNITTLISNASLISSIDYQGYKLSPSRRYLLIWTAKRKQFRHSFTAKYFLYDIKMDLISLLSTRKPTTGTDDEAAKPSLEHELNRYEHLDSASLYLSDHNQASDASGDNDELARFQLVDWFSTSSSTGHVVDSLILVQNNNLHILANVADLSSTLDAVDRLAVAPTQLTSTGRPNEFFNGIPDWLYEEEILAQAPAFQVSPSGSRLAYMTFNDSRVATMPYSLYGDQVIPRIQRIKYPKAGRPNPVVSVRLIDKLLGDESQRIDVELKLPADLAGRQHYINRISWLGEHRLALLWSNRNQNESHVLICSAQVGWSCEKNLHLEAPGGWLDISDDIYALKHDNDHYLALMPKFEGPEVGHFKHLAKVSLTRPNSFAFLTGGRKEVLSIEGVDAKRSLVFYTSTVVDEPGQRQLFVAELDVAPQSNQSSLVRPAGPSVCVTCDHYPAECLYNSAKLSPSTNYYIFHCDGPGVPRTELRATRRRSHRLSYKAPSAPAPAPAQATELAKLQQRANLLQGFPSSAPSKLSQVVVPPSDKINGAKGQPLATDGRQTKSAQPLTAPAATMLTEDKQLKRQRNQQLDTAAGSDDSVRSGENGVDEGQAAPVWPGTGLEAEAEGGSNSNGHESLLWLIEDNRELRERLERAKAMPLTMRLKVPISNTNYSANVLLLLPPQIGSTTTFRSSAPTSASTLDSALSNSQRPRRGILSGAGGAGQANPQTLHFHYTADTIRDYSSQLPPGQQFPMVVDVYAGPGSQKVDFRFNVYFGHYLASSRRTIYAMIDGRGSGYEGSKRLFELYHRLGTVEIQDQIAVVSQLTRNLTFIDPTKVAIWGWSYGGYAAAMALAQSNAQALQLRLWASRANSGGNLQQATNSTLASLVRASSASGDQQQLQPARLRLQPLGVFECAASVAPVTNWIYYDTAYTEKYMSSPWSNERYDEAQTGDHMSGDETFVKASHRAAAMSVARREHQQRIVSNRWAPLNHTVDSRFSSPPPAQLVELMMRNSLPYGSNQQMINHANMNALNLNDRYKRASLLEQIANIDRKRFLLIHGTADDNVHFQQSIMLMKRLVQKNVLFETRLYPDQDHSIANKADKLHLGSTLSNFFAECFDMAY